MKVLLLLAALFLSACSTAPPPAATSTPTEKEPPAVRIRQDDPELVAAKATARRRFPEFRSRYQKHPSGENFYVKAPFESPDGEPELMWVLVESLGVETVKGTLANDPESVPGLKFEDPVEVPIAELEDWNIQNAQGESVLGNFTAEVLRKHQ